MFNWLSINNVMCNIRRIQLVGNTWYHCWIFTDISRGNIGQNLRSMKWFHILWFGNWVMCWPNIWTCTRYQRWKFTWVICRHVASNRKSISIRIDWWHDNMFYWVNDEYNTWHNRRSLTKDRNYPFCITMKLL